MATTRQDLVGPAQWTRVDFHLHSPAISTFAPGSGINLDDPEDRARVAERWVERLVEADIQLGALTDYNRTDSVWFPLLRDQAAMEGIVLLPGAELSIEMGSNHVHVLLIAEKGTTPEQINTALQALHSKPTPLADGRNHNDIVLKESHRGMAQMLRDHLSNCLLVPAHPTNKGQGFMKAFRPGKALEFLQDIDADALEWMHPNQRTRLCGPDPEVANWFLERTVDFGDPEELAEIGTKERQDGTPRATWLRLSERSVSAVRVALQDPELRLRLGERPSEPAQARITRVRVDGRDGFLGDLDVHFSPDLTAVIGGRGVGKSALFSLLRYALDLEPFRPDADRDGLVEHSLGSGGKVTVSVVGSGGEQRDIVRIRGEEPWMVTFTGDRIDGTPRQWLGAVTPILLRQRELQYIAEAQQPRRDLLRQLIGRPAEAARAKLRSLEAELEENAAALRTQRSRLERRDEDEKALADVSRRLQALEEMGGSPALAEHRAAQRRHRAAGTVQERAERLQGDIADRIRATEEELTALLRDWTAATDGEGAVGPSRDRAEEVTRTATDALMAARSAIDSLVELAAELREATTKQQDDAAEDLAELKQQLATDDLDPDQLLALDSRRGKLKAAVEAHERAAERVARLRSERDELLTRLRAARREEFELLDGAVQQVNDRLRVDGTQLAELVIGDRGDTDAFTSALVDLVQGSNIQRAALADLADEHADGLSIVRAGEDKWSLSTAMRDRLATWLDDDENRFALEVLSPEHSVVIRLSVEDGTMQPLEKLSLGQKATAMLLLLFATQDRPLLLDQPEDDLDNRFVFDDVVPLLRRAKHPDVARQVVVATHNANIPVLGDAEQILALETVERRGRVAVDGSIDRRAVRDQVRLVLEGGEEAFRRRSEKYGSG